MTSTTTTILIATGALLFGGVATAEDAFSKIAAGASLVQLYTAMIYGGPALPARIVRGLDDRLEREQLTVGALIGRDAAAWAG